MLSKKAKWFGIVVVLMVCAFGLWRGAGIYANYKEKRLTAQARLLLQSGKYKEALLTTQHILGTNPTNVEACRLMADLTERAKDPSTLVWRRQVAQLSPTLENRLTLAAAAMLFERPPFPLAHQTLENIKALGQETAAYHVIAAQLALKLNRLEDAGAHYQAAIKLEPEKESHQLNLAVLRLQAKDPQAVAEARATLERFCANPRFAAPALRSLVSESLEKKDFERARQFSTQLLTQPQTAYGDRVQHLNLLHNSRSPDFSDFLATVRNEAATNEFHVYQLASWMSARGLAAEARAWIETLPPDLQARQPVPRAVVECLLAQKDWAGLESFLNAQQWAGQDFVRLALLSLALRNQDLRDAGQLRLQGAMRLAAKHPETLAVLSQMLESWGWQSEADDLLLLLVKTFPHASPACRAVCLAFYTRGNTPGLYEVYSTLLKSGPADAPTKNNFAMVALLLNTNLSQAHALAEEVQRAEPRNPAYVSTRAFSLHLQGRNPEALALLQTLPATDLETPGIALYYAITLAAAGEVEPARKFLSLAGHAQLLPEEKRLLEQTKNSLK